MPFSEENQRRGHSEKKSNKKHWFNYLWISLAILLILAMLCARYYFFHDQDKLTNTKVINTQSNKTVVNPENDKKEQYATKEEIKQAIDNLNKKLSYLSVSIPDDKQRVFLVNENGKSEDSKSTQYIISIQDKHIGKVSIFDAKQYVMNLWSEKQKSKEPLKLCEAIDKTLKANDEILKALQDMDIKGSLSLALWGVVNIGVEFKPPEIAQIELVAILRTVLRLKAKKVEVLIKGYADGQTYPWDEPLFPSDSPYHYTSINVYVPLDENRLNWLEYRRKESPLPIPKDYTNEQLPDLRAQFVKEELINRTLRHCEDNAETEVHILKGQSYKSNKIYEPDRKVEIFLNVY